MTDEVQPSKPLTPHKMKFGTAAHMRLTVELDLLTVNALFVIRDALRRSSVDPTREVSISVATRRAISLYAEALTRQTDEDVLKGECHRATENTYLHTPHRRRKLVK